MNIDQQIINTVRVLSAEAVQKANSGHPGLPLGAAPMAYTLWDKVLKHNPKNPDWFNRDRFILSAGHGSALLYSLLHLYGYGLTLEDIEDFRQLDSLTPGHPEYGHTKGVEATTGPLGQGLAMGVGMAMAEEHLAALYNKEDAVIIDHYTYVLVGDGCLMEGITNEASSLAGTLGLSKLIVLYDSNNISIEGGTDLAFTENVAQRYEALGWDVHFVADGNDVQGIRETIEKCKENKDKPSFIEIKTKIGFGSPKEGSASAHGEPLGDEGVASLKKKLGWKEEEPFCVPEEVKAHLEERQREGLQREEEWNRTFEAYKKEYPEDASRLEDAIAGKMPLEYLDSDEFYAFEKSQASRGSSGDVLNRVAEKLPRLFGGSADLGPSNKSVMKNTDSFSKENRKGGNIHFGVREHAMAAIANGIALHKGLIPYCATFLIFSDYLKPAIRLSALMKQQVIYVFTHDSIGVGEDGPTHQPVDQLPMLRAVPGLVNFRPCDNRETAAAWSYALQRTDGPTTLSLTRQNLTDLEGSGRGALKGGYVLSDCEGAPELIFIATGSEVAIAVEAAESLREKGRKVRVVSMPSMEVFEQQEESYRNEVLPPAVTKRIAVEAASPLSWGKYVGLEGNIIAMDTFGASAPAGKLFERFGFTAEHLIKRGEDLLEK